jgi:alpha-tubulin suppressor-like RCC1 family protein
VPASTSIWWRRGPIATLALAACGVGGDGTGSPEQAHAWRLRPTAVKDVSGARAIVAGDEFSCALVAQGHVRCWGNDQTGAMGFNAELDVDDENFHYRRTADAVRGVSGAGRVACFAVGG